MEPASPLSSLGGLARRTHVASRVSFSFSQPARAGAQTRGGVSGCRCVRVASGSDLRFGGAVTGRWAGRTDKLFPWGLDATWGKAHACLGSLRQGDPGQESASLVGSSVYCSGLFHPRVLLCGSSLSRW